MAESDAVAVQRALLAGTRLPHGLRTKLESHVAGDLSDLWLHRGPAATAATSRLGTRAFTVGHDVVLGARAPEPHTVAGLQLLVHEATHALQEPPGKTGPLRRIRREDGEDAVSDGGAAAPVVDEEPDPGLNVSRAIRLNQVWWTELELQGVRPLGDVTPTERPATYANRVLGVQRASRAPHLQAYTLDRSLATDGILGPRTLWFLWRLASARTAEGDLVPFRALGADLEALAGAANTATIALAIIRHPLVAARWTFTVAGDQALRYYRQHYELNQNDADLLDRVLFDGAAPSDVTRDDRHELLSLLFGHQDLQGVGALVSVDRTFLHEVDSNYVVRRGRRGAGRWSPVFAFRITRAAAADEAVADLGLSVPATPRARRVRERLEEGGPPTSGLLVAIDIPEIDPIQRDAVVQQYLARQRVAREQRQREVEEHNRWVARQRADRFLELARDSRRDARFTVALQHLVRDFAGQPPSFFEYFLDDLRGREPEQLTAFFNAVEGVRAFSVHAPVIRLSLGTSYADDERVRRSLAVLNSRRQGVMHSRYGTDGVRLGGEYGPLLRVGDVAGDLHGAYLRDESLDRIKPARMAELAEVAKKKAGDIYAGILANRTSESPTQEDVATKAFELAAKDIGLTEDDVERDVEYEESVRLTSIRQVTEEGIERTYLTWEVVKRWGGSGEWTQVQEVEESGDDVAFDFLLSLYRLSQTADVLEGMATGLVIVGGIAVAWKAGLVGLLLRAAGGTGMVLGSIGISTLIYVATSYRRDQSPTLRGFLFAALDGYLGALAFRGFSPLGAAISSRFVSGGTATMRQLVAGWLLSRGAVGALSGAATMPASMFARELVEVLSGDRSRFSSLGDYLTQAAYGALFGAAFEIAGSGLLSLFRGQGANALARASDVAARVLDLGIKPGTWLAESAGVLSRFQVWAVANLHDDIAGTLGRELRARLEAVGVVLGQAGRTARARWRVEVMSQLLDLAERELSRDATSGLERMLLAGQGGGRGLSDDAAIDILQRLRADPDRIDPFLALMKDVPTPVLDDLVARGALGELADAPAALATVTRLSPAGTGALLRDGFHGSVGDLEAFVRALGGLDDGLQSHAWTALIDHRDLVAALATRGSVITPRDVAGLGRLSAHADIDQTGLRSMIGEFDSTQARGFLADATGAAERRLAELAQLSGQGRDGARRYLQRQRLAQRGRTPTGPDANATPPRQANAPVAPVPHPTPGPREAAARSAVPAEDEIGFDIFMDQLRTNTPPANPELVLARRSQEQVNAVARARRLGFERAQRAARAHARFHDDPLDPQLLNSEQLGDVTLRYEGRSTANGGRPSNAEIRQAQDVARITKEHVEVFGDTVLGNEYPGIDGVIGSPRRPLSLKQSNGLDNVGYARVHARDALTAARDSGYSHVEVHINMYGSTVADIQAALHGVPANPRGAGPLFDNQDTIAKYVFHGTDGSFILEPPL